MKIKDMVGRVTGGIKSSAADIKSSAAGAVTSIGEVDIKSEDLKSLAVSTAKNTGKAGAVGAGTMITMTLTTAGLAAAGVAAAPLIGGIAGTAALGIGVKSLWGRKKKSKITDGAGKMGATAVGMGVGALALGPIGSAIGGAAGAVIGGATGAVYRNKSKKTQDKTSESPETKSENTDGN